MGRNSKKKHKIPLLSLSKLRESKGRLDFKEMFNDYLESEEARLRLSLAYGYGEVGLWDGDFVDDFDDYNSLWAIYGQGNKFNKVPHTSHRYPPHSVGNRAVVKKYLGNHTHTRATQKSLWEKDLVEDAEIINDEDPVSLIDKHFETDPKAFDPIKIYYYRDYNTESDVEVFTNLNEFDQFVQDNGIIISDDVCQQILQSDEIHCSIDPYYWYRTGDQYLICESSYDNLSWECRDRACDAADSAIDSSYMRSNCHWD